MFLAFPWTDFDTVKERSRHGMKVVGLAFACPGLFLRPGGKEQGTVGGERVRPKETADPSYLEAAERLLGTR